MKKKNVSTDTRTKRKPPQGLKAPKEDYQPLNLRLNWDKKEVRKEYSRLRSIYRKRLERLSKSEYSDSGLFQDRPIERYRPLKEITSERELQHLLSELAYLIDSRTTTIKGNREIDTKRMETIKEKYGIEMNNRQDLKDFGEFMEKIRDFTQDRIYDSDFASELYANKDKVKSSDELVKLYKEFLKTGSRNIPHLQSKLNKTEKRRKSQSKTRRKRRKR